MEIKLNDVSYKDNKIILDNINLNIKLNTITGIIGKSGSGKTTLLELIDNLIEPTSGSIKNKNKVGMVFQFCEEQFFCSTVKKELEFGLNYLNKDINQIEKKINDALIMVGLSDTILNRNPFTLSNGEKRKLAIATVLAFNPEVIILDNPTIDLDNKSRTNLIKILKTLKTRYNKTIIIASDVDTLHEIADEIIVIDNGKVVMQGNKYEVFTSNDYNYTKPKIIEFEQMVLKEKNVKLLYRDDINDLMKDIYRSVK